MNPGILFAFLTTFTWLTLEKADHFIILCCGRLRSLINYYLLTPWLDAQGLTGISIRPSRIRFNFTAYFPQSCQAGIVGCYFQAVRARSVLELKCIFN